MCSLINEWVNVTEVQSVKYNEKKKKNLRKKNHNVM